MMAGELARASPDEHGTRVAALAYKLAGEGEHASAGHE
jgi:hypothetical protein